VTRLRFAGDAAIEKARRREGVLVTMVMFLLNYFPK